MTGRIFNIQRYSIHDGPGIRTTVFFKGCPLKCQWCHNPESQSYERDIMIFGDKCINCGFCVRACDKGALDIKDNEVMFKSHLCTKCGKCCEACPTGCRAIVGEDKTVEYIMKEIEKDRVFYEESQGGVTFSGGEPLSQGEILKEILKRCSKEKIHTVVDTSGYGSKELIKDIVPYVDLFLYDLKSIDDTVHKKFTAVSNKIILENLKLIGELQGNIYIRIPIIPGINDSEEQIDSFIDVIKNVKGVLQVNILPYHHISEEKYRRLNRVYQCKHIEEPRNEHMEFIKNRFEKVGFKTIIGG